MEKRTVSSPTRRGMSVSDLILVAVLLAAGAVLKYFAGSIINIAGMKPNFIIAMYCLAILLIRPRLHESLIIGLLAGAVCQLFPGTPYINLISEVCGAAVMGLMVKLPMISAQNKLVSTAANALAAFVSTVVSGGVFTVCLFLVLDAAATAMAAYVPIVLCTAIFNAVIVSLLALPLKAALHR